MNIRIGFLLSLFFILLLFQNCTASKNRIVAEVGSYKIIAKEAAYRDEVVWFYMPDEKRKLGLDQLINAYTSAEILKNNGQIVTDEILDAEEHRIEIETKQPEKLSQLKAIFRGDEQAYRRVVLLPAYAERAIYFKLFLQDSKAAFSKVDYNNWLILEKSRVRILRLE